MPRSVLVCPSRTALTQVYHCDHSICCKIRNGAPPLFRLAFPSSVPPVETPILQHPPLPVVWFFLHQTDSNLVSPCPPSHPPISPYLCPIIPADACLPPDFLFPSSYFRAVCLSIGDSIAPRKPWQVAQHKGLPWMLFTGPFTLLWKILPENYLPHMIICMGGGLISSTRDNQL